LAAAGSVADLAEVASVAAGVGEPAALAEPALAEDRGLVLVGSAADSAARGRVLAALAAPVSVAQG
jgi:hypothetical protein